MFVHSRVGVLCSGSRAAAPEGRQFNDVIILARPPTGPAIIAHPVCLG